MGFVQYFRDATHLGPHSPAAAAKCLQDNQRHAFIQAGKYQEIQAIVDFGHGFGRKIAKEPAGALHRRLNGRALPAITDDPESNRCPVILLNAGKERRQNSNILYVFQIQ